MIKLYEQRRIKNAQILDFEAMCNQNYTKQGMSQALSMIIVKNLDTIKKASAELKTKLYDRRHDEQYMNYENARNELLQLYCDKDEGGKPVQSEDGQLQFTANILEAQQELAKLDAENEKLLSEVNEKIKSNEKVLNDFSTLDLYLSDDYSELPEKLEPYWYSILVVL